MSFITMFTAGLAAMAPFAAALTAPKGDPSGNAIYEPGLNSIVPVGKPYEITWDPTTEGKVSLVLLHGPSTNVVPIATIADSIDNVGKYSWTPSTDLAPNSTYYGLQIIVEGPGQYQYSTQFGISNPDFKGDASSSSSNANTGNKVPLTSEISSIIASATGVVSSIASGASSAGSAIVSSANGAVSSAVASASGEVSSAASVISAASGSISSAVASGLSSRTATRSSATGSSTRSGSASVASSTGGAGKIGAGLGSLALAAGVAAYVL